jgi:hypothetical protein
MDACYQYATDKGRESSGKGRGVGLESIRTFRRQVWDVHFRYTRDGGGINWDVITGRGIMHVSQVSYLVSGYLSSLSGLPTTLPTSSAPSPHPRPTTPAATPQTPNTTYVS